MSNCETTVSGEMSISERLHIPFWLKSNLTIEEAAAFSGVGRNKLRELSDDETSRIGDVFLFTAPEWVQAHRAFGDQRSCKRTFPSPRKYCMMGYIQTGKVRLAGSKGAEDFPSQQHLKGGACRAFLDDGSIRKHRSSESESESARQAFIES